MLANTWAWPITGDRHVEVFSHLMGGPPTRLLTRRFNLFVNVMIAAGHRLRKLTAAEMANYRQAFRTRARRDASAVLPRRITLSRALLTTVEAGPIDPASLPTQLVWGEGGVAFQTTERHRWERAFADHHTLIVDSAGHFVQSDVRPVRCRRPALVVPAQSAAHADVLRPRPSPTVPGVLMTYDPHLAERVRELLADGPPVTEKAMFGGLAFLVDGKMAVAASGQGGLLVRADPERAELLLTTTTARPMEMKGRAIQGWLRVDGDDLRTKRQLARWVAIGTATALSAPAKR